MPTAGERVAALEKEVADLRDAVAALRLEAGEGTESKNGDSDAASGQVHTGVANGRRLLGAEVAQTAPSPHTKVFGVSHCTSSVPSASDGIGQSGASIVSWRSTKGPCGTTATSRVVSSPPGSHACCIVRKAASKEARRPSGGVQ